MTNTPGIVYLVGAGPGDPGLLSLRGRECLALAEVVLYDGLVNPLLLRHAHVHCERTCRTGGPDGKRLNQEQINQQLVREASAGKTVVRLKGGDPYIFGRGSEEAAALKRAGIPFEVVPGVTAAVAAAEYAGISLTHREHASAVAFITGHEDPGKPDSALDYRNLATFSGTLVFYMGLHRLPKIVASLIEAGKDPQTSACVISHGTWTTQRTVTAALAELPARVSEAQLEAPSLIVIGECVSLRDELAWFEERPLFGQRIAITRPLEQAYDTAELALQWGAVPLLMPTIEILPPEDWTEVDRTIDKLDEFDWLIFTSRNGVRAFFQRLLETGHDLRSLHQIKIAAIGSATAATIREYHLNADVVPDSFRAEALAAELKERVRDQRVLWACANRGRDVLPDELNATASSFTRLVVYRNRDVESLSEEVVQSLAEEQLDWIALSSPSIAHSVARLLPETIKDQLGKTIRIAAISPVTEAAAKEAGLPVNVVATTFTWPGIFEAISHAV